MIKKVFDVYEGEEVLIYTVKSEYLEADILTFGATVHALRVKDKRGDLRTSRWDIQRYQTIMTRAAISARSWEGSETE